MAYASLNELKEYLGISVATDDNLLTRLLNAATAQIEQYTGRVFAAVAATRYFASDSVARDVLILDEELAGVSSIVNGDGAAVTSYALLPRNSTPSVCIRILGGQAWVADDEHPVAVTATWGYSVSPPPDVVQACVRLAAYYYRQKDAQVYDVTAEPALGVITVPAGMPADVKVLLEPYVRVAYGYA